MNLYKLLQEKLKDHIPSEVEELNLDGIFDNVRQFSESDKKDLEKYTNLKHLSLNGFGLETLKNFPNIPSLLVLELQDNKLIGNDFIILSTIYPELYKLKLGNNPIKSLEVFKVFKDSNLRKIELQGTPVAEDSEFQANLFSMIDSLEVVNNTTLKGEIISTTDYDYENCSNLYEEEGVDSDEEYIKENDFEDIDDAEEEDEDSDKPTKKSKKNYN